MDPSSLIVCNHFENVFSYYIPKSKKLFKWNWSQELVCHDATVMKKMKRKVLTENPLAHKKNCDWYNSQNVSQLIQDLCLKKRKPKDPKCNKIRVARPKIQRNTSRKTENPTKCKSRDPKSNKMQVASHEPHKTEVANTTWLSVRESSLISRLISETERKDERRKRIPSFSWTKRKRVIAWGERERCGASK